jgi:hypothetical protein
MPTSYQKAKLSMYAAAATTIPLGSMETAAKAEVFTQTGLSHKWGIQSCSTTGTAAFTFNITGASGAIAGVAQGNGNANASNPSSNFPCFNSNVYLAFGISNASFRGMRQQGADFNVQGGLPVEQGATWDNVGRSTGEFAGTNVAFSTTTSARLNLGGSRVFNSSYNPQGLGVNSNDPLYPETSWALLFKFTSGAAAGNYGWISFDAYIFDEITQYVTITGWGWDDTGAKIAAPDSATGTMPSNSNAVPGVGGLIALAAGCGGIRQRRTR